MKEINSVVTTGYVKDSLLTIPHRPLTCWCNNLFFSCFTSKKDHLSDLHIFCTQARYYSGPKKVTCPQKNRNWGTLSVGLKQITWNQVMYWSRKITRQQTQRYWLRDVGHGDKCMTWTHEGTLKDHTVSKYMDLIETNLSRSDCLKGTVGLYPTLDWYSPIQTDYSDFQ